MKIVICGSIAFFKHMKAIKEKLEPMGHDIVIPKETVEMNKKNIPVEEFYKIRKSMPNNQEIWEFKNRKMTQYFQEIKRSDAILVLNLEKNGIDGYIGGNTFLEMGIAMCFGKKIFLINNIPDMGYKEEILAMKPTIINNDLEMIK